MYKKTISRIAAFAAAGVITGTLAASVLAKDVECKEIEYTTPMTTNRSSAIYKDFISASPKLSFDDKYYYYSAYGGTLKWTEVENALLYYVYVKSGNSFRLAGKSATNYIYLSDLDSGDSDGTECMVKAVTYDYNDRRILSAASNTVTIKQRRRIEVSDCVGEEVEEEYEPEYEADDASVAVYAAAVPAMANTGASTKGYAYIPYDPPVEEYSHYEENNYKKASDSPLSTISADVDTASYANARRMINSGRMPTQDSVRTEEFLNYFDYNYVQPQKQKFTVTYELSDCPWNKDAQLLMLGIQTKDLEKEPDSNLVFLVDVSGSMDSSDKLELVGDSLKKLSDELSANDTISVVTYSGEERVVVSGAKGSMKKCLSDIADSLYADGCTNGEAGINMAYEIAADHYIKGGSNRVILATDGDLNVGISDKDELSKFISKKRDTGVYLTVLGVGTGNLKDNKMEALAKDGNGNYHYIDCAEEATKVLVDERRSTLITAADDVKFQVEFNPTLVDSYRLVGYESRRLENEDFSNDQKDAADMGAGQSVTVMYEIKRTKSAADSLKYQKSSGNKTDICTVKMRFKNPGEKKSLLSSVTVKAANYCKYKDAGVQFKFASCVAEAAMAMKHEQTAENVSLNNAYKRLTEIDSRDLKTIGYSDDFKQVLKKAVAIENGHDNDD